MVVVLAAGLGSRFGGVKQLTPVGPAGDVILDYTARDAMAAGFETIVVVTRSELEGRLAERVGRWPEGIRPILVCQDRDLMATDAAAAGRTKPLGTVHAALSGMEQAPGCPAVVVNADDFYGTEPFRLLARHLHEPSPDVALVTFPVAGTVISSDPVTRALCDVDPSGALRSIEEGTVSDGSWVGRSGRRVELEGHEPVSMNCWGFPGGLAHAMREVTERFVTSNRVATEDEVLLPDLVRAQLTEGVRVAALPGRGRCVGLTHPGDVDLVRPCFTEPAW